MSERERRRRREFIHTIASVVRRTNTIGALFWCVEGMNNSNSPGRRIITSAFGGDPLTSSAGEMGRRESVRNSNTRHVCSGVVLWKRARDAERGRRARDGGVVRVKEKLKK